VVVKLSLFDVAFNSVKILSVFRFVSLPSLDKSYRNPSNVYFAPEKLSTLASSSFHIIRPKLLIAADTDSRSFISYTAPISNAIPGFLNFMYFV